MVKTKPKEDIIETTQKSECKVVNVNGRAELSHVLTLSQVCGQRMGQPARTMDFNPIGFEFFFFFLILFYF